MKATGHRRRMGLGAAGLIGLSMAAAVTAVARPPNVVLILADDLGIMDVGAYATRLTDRRPESLYYETPSIDALVRRGIAFSQAYANQLCSPTRAAILTGRIASRLGVTTATPRTQTFYNQGIDPPPGHDAHEAFAHQDPIPEQQAWRNGFTNTAIPTSVPTIPTVLTTHDCAFLGKWHVGGHGAWGRQPHDHGFRELAYFDSGGSPYFNWRKQWDNRKCPWPTMPQTEFRVGSSGKDTGADYLTEDLTNQAVEYLHQRAQRPEDPFFLYFAHFSVHTPLQARPELVQYFEAKATRGSGGHDHPVYAAMVKHLDDSVGRILDTLTDTGLAANTLVVFTSDNGGVEYTNPPATDNAPFKGGKACLYEGGVRVPLVVYQPDRFDQGTWCVNPVDCTDLLPTFAELTGNPCPPEVDGRSLVPHLLDPRREGRPRTFIWHYPYNVIVRHPDHGSPLTPHSAIRVGDLKLIWDWHGKLELYDIPKDPYEERDLSGTYPDKTRQLLAQLQTWLQTNVKPQYFPSLNPDYDAGQDTRPYPFGNLWPATSPTTDGPTP